jgi:hypothetical protein
MVHWFSLIIYLTLDIYDREERHSSFQFLYQIFISYNREYIHFSNLIFIFLIYLKYSYCIYCCPVDSNMPRTCNNCSKTSIFMTLIGFLAFVQQWPKHNAMVGFPGIQIRYLMIHNRISYQQEKCFSSNFYHSNSCTTTSDYNKTRSYYRKENAADMYMQDVLQPKSVFFTVCFDLHQLPRTIVSHISSYKRLRGMCIVG